MLDYDDLGQDPGLGRCCPASRKHASEPEHPTIRNTGETTTSSSSTEKPGNSAYIAFPDIVEDYMNKISALTGRDYKPFNYYVARRTRTA